MAFSQEEVITYMLHEGFPCFLILVYQLEMKGEPVLWNKFQNHMPTIIDT